MHAPLPSPFLLCLMCFPGPPTRSRLEEQLMGVLQPHDQQRSQSADELQTEPWEGLCGMSHVTSICSPEADWVTEQCSGNITKTLLNFCLPLCLPLHLSLAISTGVPFAFPPSLPPLPQPPNSWVGASWACYPNPTVVAAFVSLTKGPALYTCQGANESNKQGPGKRGGQASAVLLSFTGFLAAALPWKLGNPQSASLMSDDALALMETSEKTHLQKEITCCSVSAATRGRRHIQSVWVRSVKDLKGKYHLWTHNNWLW